MAVRELENKGIVVKANELIERPYTMTTREKRLILILAATIRMEDTVFNTVKISLRDLNKLLKVSNENIYNEIEDITEKLLSRVIKYKPADGELIQTHWIEKAHYKKRKGYVEIRFSDEMREYLLQLGGYFTKYRLSYALPLNSFYSIRLYEILKMDYTTNKAQAYYNLEDLKVLIGIVPPKYKLYGDFKRKILVSSQKQFQKLTDIIFAFKEKKEGKKVVGITFVIRPNEKVINQGGPSEDDPDKDRELYERLVNYFCLSPVRAKEVLKKYPTKQLKENLAYVENEYQKGKIKNIASYTYKAIKENFRLQTSLFDSEREEAKTKVEEKERQERQREKDELDYDSYITQEIEKRKAQLPEDDFNKIQKDIEKNLLKSGKKRGNIFDISLRIEVDRYFRDKWRNEFMSFEEWLAKNRNDDRPKKKA